MKVEAKRDRYTLTISGLSREDIRKIHAQISRAMADDPLLDELADHLAMILLQEIDHA